MPSTFFGLTIGYSGLLNYQAALNTTGHNISNVKGIRGRKLHRLLQERSVHI